MPNDGLAIGVLQLVALSLPAFAILMQIVVESEFPYANEAVPAVALSFGFIVAGGVVVLTQMLFTELSLLMRVALVLVDVGLAGLVVGVALVGLRTHRAQEQAATEAAD